MKEYHFRKYSLEDKDAYIKIIGKGESRTIPKNKIKDVFALKSFLWGHVKWYHRLLVGIILSALSVFCFFVLHLLGLSN